jgi:hypothetical protein
MLQLSMLKYLSYSHVLPYGLIFDRTVAAGYHERTTMTYNTNLSFHRINCPCLSTPCCYLLITLAYVCSRSGRTTNFTLKPLGVPTLSQDKMSSCLDYIIFWIIDRMKVRSGRRFSALSIDELGYW